MEFSANIDAGIIQQIADSLGLAVDATAGLIDQYLPAYAQLKVMQLVAPAITAIIIFITCIVVAIIGFRTAHKHMRIDANAESISDQKYCTTCRIHGRSSSDGVQYISWWVGAITTFVTIIAFIAILYFIGHDIPLIITWMNTPEAMLFDAIVNKAV